MGDQGVTPTGTQTSEVSPGFAISHETGLKTSEVFIEEPRSSNNQEALRLRAAYFRAW